MTHYTDGAKGYHAINDPLRAGTPLSAKAKADVAALDSLIGSSVVPHDLILYRGVAEPGMFDKLEAGHVFTDQGYVSLTHDVKTAITYSLKENPNPRNPGAGEVVQVRIPKGSHAFDISTTKENEVLVGRGGRFKVTQARTPGKSLQVTYYER